MWLNLIFLFLPIMYFAIHWHYHKTDTFFKDFKTFFGINKINYKSFYKGILLFVILFVVSIIINLIVYLFFPQYNDLGKVSDTILSYIQLGKIFYFFVTLVVGVFLEEFFFRSFLVPRLGVIFSTLAFALLHYGYGSWVEIGGAFVLGLVLAYYYKKNNDLFINFYGHIIYNILVVLLAIIAVM